MIEVPAVVRNKALVAGAGDWLEGLPDLLGERPAAGQTARLVLHPFQQHLGQSRLQFATD